MNTPNAEIDEAIFPISLRKAVISDMEFILNTEKECFAEHRQSTRRSVCNSINSLNQRVLIAELDSGSGSAQPAGVAIAFIYKRSLRIYSLAVSPQYRRLGIGESLIQSMTAFSLSLGHQRITLEVDASNNALISWYQKFGFETSQFLPNYYCSGEAAYRMTKKNADNTDRLILVTDEDINLQSITDNTVVSARDYLSGKEFAGTSSYHVINLCSTHALHSIGYYISLMAAARNHRVIPSAMTFKDWTEPLIAQSILDEIQHFIAKKLKNAPENQIEITILFGQSTSPKFSEIGKKLFSLFNLPLFSLTLEKEQKWTIKEIHTLSMQEVMTEYPEVLKKSLLDYQSKRYHRRRKLLKYKYDLAILINKDEAHPPSSPLALEQFAKAAEKIGFFVEFITKADKHRICEFDALFIRETTALGNHTYSIARHAYTEGLVVIDDPWSILLCSNKIYLHERLANAGILQPKGWLLAKNSLKPEHIQSFTYPLVLKLPESSFSLGVFRVNSPSEMEFKIEEMFKESDLVLAQEFLPSDYDWRIGIIDNQPIFSCKYYMANKHWQIYNWQSEIANESYGRHESVPINKVPNYVLKTALKAAALIGNGLYGIDIKETGQKAYLIEINDNPNIDFGVEDAILGDELYERIMRSIYNRIEIERHQTRYLL